MEETTKFDRVKNTIADRIHGAADSIRRKAEDPDAPAGLGSYGPQVSSMLEKSADCIRDFDIRRVDAQLKNQIRTNPGRSLLIAAGAGVLVGIWLKRR